MRRILAALFFVTAFAHPAMAEDYLVPYLGYYDITQGDDSAVQFGGEYRFSAIDFGLRPTLGVSVTSDGSVYGYGGLNWDIPLTNELYIIPNFMAGLYGRGDGKDLGGAIEFRSGIELSYQLPNRQRLGIAFNHTSNASIYDHNPGVEVLLVNYSIPISQIFN